MDKEKLVKRKFIISFKILLIFFFCYYYYKIKSKEYLEQKYFLNNSSNLITLFTKWGESLDKNNILQEYPRPQFVRDSYLNLNGEWEYSLKYGNQKPYYKDKIIVPFSIESPLSGVKGKSLKPGMTLWYKKMVDLTKIENKGRFLLHFGAVDQFAEIFINGKKVGEHDGGYTSFYFDITNYIKTELSKIKIEVRVQDNCAKDGAAIGKQGNPRGGVFYVRTGGIWQTVWVESVPNNYIKDVKITPLYDIHSVSFFMTIEGDQTYNNTGYIKIFDNEDKIINSSSIIPNIQQNITIHENFKSWSPEVPYLYKVEYIYGEDIVRSYFGMRKFSIDVDKNNIKRLFLNNKPYFQKGVLDQGYWSDGYYTAPSDEAIKFDIKTMKDLGFNMLRKHIKIEPKRWYYHCDTIGMLVWQDQPSGGEFPYPVFDNMVFISDNNYDYFFRGSEIGRNNYIRDLNLTINQLYNAPCISTWVPFNEGWGQFDSVKIANIIKVLDKTRFVDHASGWVDQNGPDFKSIHIYNSEIKFDVDQLNRPIVLSEFGGLGCIIDKHIASKNNYSYSSYENEDKLTEAIKNLIVNEIYPNIEKGLSASIYTQLSDIEDENNGFFTYDRKVLKVNINTIKNANNLLKLE